MKKILIVCLVVVAFATVIGVHDHLNYDGFQRATEYVRDSADELDTFALLQGFVNYWKYFDLSKDQQVTFGSSGTDETIGRYDDNWYNGPYTGFICLWDDLYSDDSKCNHLTPMAEYGNPTTNLDGTLYYQKTGTMSVYTLQYLKPIKTLMSHDAIDGWTDYLKVPAYFVMLIVGSVVWLVVILFGAIESAVSVIVAGLYLVGLMPLL